MAKQDVLDAINATIVENNQKGITAQALNNVLTLMTENAGEGGSGDGAIKVRVLDYATEMYISMFADSFPDNAGLQTFLSTGEFSPTTWADIKIFFNTIEGGMGDSMDPVIAEMFAYNADVYTQLVQKVESNEGVLALADMSQLMSVMMSNVDGISPASSIGAPCMFMGMRETDDSGTLYMDFTPCVIFDKSDFGIPQSAPFELKEDGSLFYLMPDDKSFIIPENGYDLTDEQKTAQVTFAKNCYYNNWSISELEPAITNSSGGTISNHKVSLLYISTGTNPFTGVYYYNNAIKQVDIASDGTTTITILGTLTA